MQALRRRSVPGGRMGHRIRLVGAAARVLAAAALLGAPTIPVLAIAQEPSALQQQAAELAQEIEAAVQAVVNTTTDPDELEQLIAEAIANVIDGADPVIAQAALTQVQAQIAAIVAASPAAAANPQLAARVQAAVSQAVQAVQAVVTAAVTSNTSAVTRQQVVQQVQGTQQGTTGAGPPSGGGGGGGSGGGTHPTT